MAGRFSSQLPYPSAELLTRYAVVLLGQHQFESVPLERHLRELVNWMKSRKADRLDERQSDAPASVSSRIFSGLSP
jgi:hypothetical protein